MNDATNGPARRSRRSWLLLTLGMLAAGPAAAQEPIKIGWLPALTGPLSSSSIAEDKGVQFAVDEINAAGGINGRKVQLVTRDTEGIPTKAVNFAQQLVLAEKVQFVIGPVNSGESLATLPVISKAGIPNIIVSAVDDLIGADKFPRAFRTINTNEQWIDASLDYLLNGLKRRKIAIIGETSGYSVASVKSINGKLAAVGITPVSSAVVDANKTDLTDEITKARQAGADVILTWTGAVGVHARVLNARGNIGWDVPVVAQVGILAWPVKNLVNKASYLDNVFAAGYAGTTYNAQGELPPATAAFMKAMGTRLGEPGKIEYTMWQVALGYDCVKVIEHAIRKAGSTDGAAIQKALEETKDLKGVFATYSWSAKDRNGVPNLDIVMNLANSYRDGNFKVAPR
ncbi:ABC transporter substrate-binding protein [Reyranella sp.]|uniref:ABC transporter substrate-binding protein n=1 Tax=Reyranella sp. TaxID=1929291 RepID=UPI003783CBD9